MFITVWWLLPAKAQKTSADSANYVKSYWYNGINLVKQPFAWGKEGWITAGGSLVFVASMLTLDEAINQPISTWQTDFAVNFGNAGDIVGGLPVQGGITAGAFLAGQLFKNNKLTHFGLDNLQAQVFTGGVALVIKNLSHRARPETGEGAFKWYGPFKGWGNESFFSGHTAFSFCTANMVYLHSGKKWWVGVLGFGTATAVGLSRMQQQKHWSSDVVMGAIMGTAISGFVYKHQEKRRTTKNRIKPGF
jgi:membrane-associated phospholipid phosphatase